MNTLSRIHALVVKEFRSLLSTKSGRLLLVMPVILQTALFPFAATLEVKHATLALWNEDGGRVAVELMQRFSSCGTFSSIIPAQSAAEIEQAILTREALLAVHIPADFTRKVDSGESAPVQVILDGRRSNSSQIAYSDLQAVLDDFLGERARAANRPPPVEIIPRNAFTPNLEYTHFILPSLVAVITTIGSLVITALSVSREREEGTFDQLLVSPLTPEMIMTGKAVPAVVVGFFQATLILMAAVFLYDVPFRGHLALLYFGMFFYSLALVGVGLFISSLCKTQQQAFLGAFVFMVPAILLSGYTAPVENMPVWLQHATWINPVRHFVELVKGVFLKDAPFSRVAALIGPLVLIAVGNLSLASWLFRRRTG